MKKKSFTIVEMIVALTVFSLLFAAVMTVYVRMINVKREFDGRRYLLTTTYEMLEKINILMKDYTIDYEEYFNRSMYWCKGTGPMTGRSVIGTGWSCTRFDWYGNKSPSSLSAATQSGWHVLYRCSNALNFSDDATFSYVYSGAILATGGGCALSPYYQSFGQYRRQFINVKNNADESSTPIGDDDDTDLGKGPVAIADNENVAELYLISKDKKQKLMFRRKVVEETDMDSNGTISPYERLYVVQALQLRWFDAGSKHSFNPTDTSNQYMYDGQIDTWACDYEKWFICSGTGVNTTIYSWYNLPADENDGWVNVFGTDVTVSNRKFQIYPVKDPVYAWAENSMQINPYVRVFITSYLYGPAWSTKLNPKNLSAITYDLQTLFNIKTNY